MEPRNPSANSTFKENPVNHVQEAIKRSLELLHNRDTLSQEDTTMTQELHATTLMDLADLYCRANNAELSSKYREMALATGQYRPKQHSP
jgi:hypothetical protein